VLDLRQQRHVAAPDRRAGSVLDTEHDPDPALDALGLARGPAIAGSVLADELVEGRLQGRVGRRGEPGPQPGAHVPGHLQQHELAVRHRPQQRHVWRDGLLHIRAPAVAFLVEHAGDGEEQLLAALGRLGQADVVDADAVSVGDHAALLAAQPARAAAIDRDHPAARCARAHGVSLPSRLAART